ncbi:MAG TPA: hypothetical protein VEO96_04260 [Thermoplasmata archaeon]|nr:hypothetical protein [Thermoplasmata archaeon]
METANFSVGPAAADLRTLRLSSYFLAAAIAFNLLLRVLFVLPRLLSGSPIAFGEIVFMIAFSIFLFAVLYSLTPRYQRAYMQRRNGWYRKTPAERSRAVWLAVLGALSLSVVPIFALIYVETEISPGEDFGTYFLGAAPIYLLITAVFNVADVMWASHKAL